MLPVKLVRISKEVFREISEPTLASFFARAPHEFPEETVQVIFRMEIRKIIEKKTQKEFLKQSLCYFL